MDYKERHFSIDPGKGRKMDGCPYSTFEDGRDVKDFIVPPKGYVFKSFRFDPDASNQIYDGKLIAEYEKEPFNDILKSNLWKFLLALAIIAVITLVVLLAVNVFNKPKSPKTPKPKEPVAVVSDTVDKTDKNAKTSDTIALSEDTVKQTNAPTTIDLGDKKDEVTETPQPAAEDPNVQFKKEFWTLIHQRTIMMDPYHELYVNYKDKASGEEFDYLRLTILKDYSSFKSWYTKLHKVSLLELEAINTIPDLKNKLKEIE